MAELCEGVVHRFDLMARTCLCGEVTVPAPVLRHRRMMPGRLDAAAQRARDLAAVEKRLAEGAATHAKRRAAPRTTAKRGRPAKKR